MLSSLSSILIETCELNRNRPTIHQFLSPNNCWLVDGHRNFIKTANSIFLRRPLSFNVSSQLAVEYNILEVIQMSFIPTHLVLVEPKIVDLGVIQSVNAK